MTRLTLTTRDIGLAVRDALDLLTHIKAYADDEHGDDMEIGEMGVWNVDASEPGAVLLDLGNGQAFWIHVTEANPRP